MNLRADLTERAEASSRPSFILQHTLNVQGMHCAACARSVSSILLSSPGVSSADVHFATNSAAVEFDSAQTSVSQLNSVLQPFGYDITVRRLENDSENEQNQEQRARSLRTKMIVSIVASAILMLVSMCLSHDSPMNGLLQFILCSIVMFSSGRDFFRHAYQQLKVPSLSMDTLISLSTGIAYTWSVFTLFFADALGYHAVHAPLYFELAAVIIAFVLLGKYIEEGAKKRSQSALDSLRKLQPRHVLLRRDGEFVDAALEEVRSHDVVLVRPGERISVDGIVEEGESFVDESLLSGESTPLFKTAGALVYAGTLNQHNSLTIQARSVGDDTMLAYIQFSVEKAQQTRVVSQKLVDFVAARFIPAVLLIAIITFASWILVGGSANLAAALGSTISVLIVACPCALGLAAPIALVVSIGRAAQIGILVKSAEALEQAWRVSDIIFDKTGTLISSEREVRSIEWISQTRDKGLLHNILLSMELHSQHPLSKTLTTYLVRHGAQNLKVDEVSEHLGEGLQATFDGERYFVGSADFVSKYCVSDQMPDASSSAICFVTASEVLALIHVGEQMSDSVIDTLGRLKHMGMVPHILSGDSEEAVKLVAQQSGIEQYRARCSPAQKESYVQNLQSQGRAVAMVGDGMNDAQSLVRANVSISLGRGSDTAMNASQIVLMQSDLSRIASAIVLSKQCMRIIRQNLWWAFGYNVMLIPLASGLLKPLIGMHLDPMYAGAAMALSSISVVLNSLRLQRMQL